MSLAQTAMAGRCRAPRRRLAPPTFEHVNAPDWGEKNGFLRMNFSSSQLVRLLGTWTPVDAKASRQDFAEQMAQWLSVADAMLLHSAHQSMPSRAATWPTQAPAAHALHTAQAQALVAEVQRVHGDLLAGFQGLNTRSPGATASARSRTTGLASRSGRMVAAQRPVASFKAVMPANDEAQATFPPHHQRYLDQQRRMALRVDALRVQVRQVLTQASAPLAQLAMLDAVMDRALGGREQKLLASVPGFLEKRFEQLRLQHLSGPPAANEPDRAAPAAATTPSSSGLPALWLNLFEQDMQAALRAELEVRLQPVLGMLDALNTHCKALSGQSAGISVSNAFKTPSQA